MNRFKIFSWRGFTFCFIAIGLIFFVDPSAWAQSTDFNSQLESQQKFGTFWHVFRGYAAFFLLIGVVVAGVLYASGKPQYAVSVFLGAIVIFGTPMVVGLISNSFEGSGSLVTAGTETSIEGAVAVVINDIEGAVQSFAIILCAIYGTLLGMDSLLGGLDAARLNAFVIGTIIVCATPILSKILLNIFLGT